MTDYVGGPEDEVFSITAEDGMSNVDGGGGFDLLHVDYTASPYGTGYLDAGRVSFVKPGESDYERITAFQNVEQLTIDVQFGYFYVRSTLANALIDGTNGGATLMLLLSDETAGRTFAYDEDGVNRIGNLSFQNFGALYIYAGAGTDVLTADGYNSFFYGGGGDDILDTSANAGWARLYGQAGNDILYGRASMGWLSGGEGDDIYVVTAGATSLFEYAGEGRDAVRTTLPYYTLPAHVENLVGTVAAGQALSGNDLDNRISGDAGDDVIEGWDGNDDLAGGDGVDSVSYQHAAGAVTVSLRDGVATGGAGTDRLSGFENIRGSAFDDVLTGNNFGNILSGRDGADRLVGLRGDDDYWVDSERDSVVEVAGGGYDRVFAAVDYVLPRAVEALTLIGRGNIDAYGNGLDNVLTGNSGDNRLIGRGGEDVLIGGAGDDIYHVNSYGDRVVEATGGGNDSILASVSIDLTGTQVENARLVGRFGLDLTGSAAANVLTGNAGDNVIRGFGGDDVLTGGAGRDSFGFDGAPGIGNVDRITDFSVADDSIHLAQAAFGAITPGPLSAGAFVLGRVAMDAEDRILYDAASGDLFYDADGSGSGAAVQFAVLAPGLALTSADVLVV